MELSEAKKKQKSLINNANQNYFVYLHVFPNGKKYFGITMQKPAKRFGSNGCGYRDCPKMSNAIKKYGWENVKHYLIAAFITKSQAECMEIELIRKFNTVENGYNIEYGGNTFGTHNIETRKKISESNIGKHFRHKTDIEKIHLSEIMTGESNPFWGRKHSAESIEKIRNSRLGNVWAKRIAIQQYTLSGELIAEYETLTDAHNQTGISMASLSFAVSGKYKKAGGYVWKQKGEN